MPEHVNGNPQNNTPVKERRSRSTFDLSHYIFGTHRFGQYNVNFVQDCVGGDKIPVRSSDVIDSYTLKAPLMQDIQKTKEYFYVPKQCILPINWDKLERQPALGDDVNAENVNSTIVGFLNNSTHSLTLFYNLLLFQAEPEDYDDYDADDMMALVDCYLRRLLFAELWFSDGSLLSATGVHLSELMYFTSASDAKLHMSFDDYFDFCCSYIVNTLKVDKVKFGDYEYSFDSSKNNYISFHRFLELARDDYNFKLHSSVSVAQLKVDVGKFVFSSTATYSRSNGLGYVWNFWYGSTNAPDIQFSIDRCAAYQIVCAHYFSNDSIDYIHSADLWRQNMKSLWQSVVGALISDLTFTYNGVSTWYDDLSFAVIDKLFSFASSYSVIISLFSLDSDTFDSPLSWIGYFVNLLGWRRSLRYQDYFTGAKSRPLAVGDFSVAVNSNKVSVIDVTKKISLQRLANNVNRIGNSIEKWYKEIMGSELNYDYHNPMWLASTRSTVYASKTENTGEAQQEKKWSTVTNFVGKDSNFEFTMRPDRNGIIIGISYYDIRRSYHTGIDRMAQHVDRFDGFIPDMQFIGDQPVFGTELSLIWKGQNAISYQLRNAEYKQRVDQAYGGFVDALPGYAFMYKPELVLLSGHTEATTDIRPEFIRSRCDEFDDFYISLAGYSNAHYFHFIVKTFNDVKASRPMIFAPQIL